MINFRNMRGEADLAAYIGCSQQVVNRLLSDPPGLVFAVHEIPKRGRHGTFRRVLEVQSQDSTRIVTLVAGLPARVFVAYKRLATCEKSEYSATYLRLFESVLERRLLLYNGCDVEVAIEQNSKITREQL